jgi:adenosylcobinamide-phosphate synthase
MDFAGLGPSSQTLVAAVVFDAAFGDPHYPIHPVRLMGATLNRYERLLRKIGWNGYAGGCVLFLLLALTWVVLPAYVVSRIAAVNSAAGWSVEVFLVYSMLALRDLLDHVWAVQRAAKRNDLLEARRAIGKMVGRDTATMDLDMCRRAAIESLAENFVDGFLSAIFWYVVLGLPGLLLFKVVSTMDSMVGYKTPEYLRFGWCGARTDDLMNYLPARLAWLLLGISALAVPGLSARKGWRVGLAQHAVVPGPNPGWSEATMAGVLQRRLIGPIYRDGQIVTTVWLGDPSDPEGGNEADLTKGVQLVIIAAVSTVALAVAILGSGLL